MEKFIKTVTYSQYENDICISLNYLDGGVKGGEITIVDTRYGFQLRAFTDSWINFNEFSDVFELLSKQSMIGIKMKQLAEMIRDIGYKLVII